MALHARVTASQKGQIVIPARIRAKYQIHKGTKFDLVDKDGIIELRPLPDHPILALKGTLKGKSSLTKALLSEHAAEKKREDRD